MVQTNRETWKQEELLKEGGWKTDADDRLCRALQSSEDWADRGHLIAIARELLAARPNADTAARLLGILTEDASEFWKDRPFGQRFERERGIVDLVLREVVQLFDSRIGDIGPMVGLVVIGPSLIELCTAYAVHDPWLAPFIFVHATDGYEERREFRCSSLRRTADHYIHRLEGELMMDANRPGQDAGDDPHPVPVVIVYNASMSRHGVIFHAQ